MSFVESLIEQYGLSALFLLILLEYACFPVSSELILPLAGVLGARHGMSFPGLVLISSFCGLTGTTATYLIGRLGGSPLLEKVMQRFPSFEKPILCSYRTFGDHGKSAVFLSRLIPLCRTYIGFVAGAMKQSYLSYLLCSFLGILLWNTLLTSLGFYFYQYQDLFLLYFNRYKKWIFILAGFLLFLFLFQKLHKTNKKSETNQEELK